MTTTGIVLTTCFIVLGIYDFIVVCRRGVCCSISRCMQNTFLKSPLVAMTLGALFGHLFLYMPPEIGDREVVDYLHQKAWDSEHVSKTEPTAIPFNGYKVKLIDDNAISVRFDKSKPGDDK